MELENLVANYKGATSSNQGNALISRLLFMAEKSNALRLEAYKAAIQEITSTTGNVELYQSTVQKLNQELESRNLPSVDLDLTWISTTSQSNLEKAERLESELTNYKNNLIKESIRIGYNDLGHHHYHSGDLQDALKCFSLSKDYLTIPAHIIEMCMNVIHTSMEIDGHPLIQPTIAKIRQVPSIPEKSNTSKFLPVIFGMMDLEAGNFKSAAKQFLLVPFEKAETEMWSFVSPIELAIYGSLCSMVAFDRKELKIKVFENAEFKQFLELEPMIRETLRAFYHSRFAECFQTLERLKSSFYLDKFLHPHVERIFQEIRNRAVLQYCYPFLSVDMVQMAEVFSCSVTDIEAQLVGLITDNLLAARIDSHKKVVRARGVNQRSKVFQTVLENGKEFQNQAYFIHMRAKLIQANLTVKLPNIQE